jgi:hypothetical protein
MNFKDWLLSEGKAMDVSEDMINFAKEVVAILEKRKWKFGETIHQRVVNSKYGNKEIKVKTGVDSPAAPLAQANPETSTIKLFLAGKDNPEYKAIEFGSQDNGLPFVKQNGTAVTAPKIPDYDVDVKDCYYNVIHELVHLFDVKVLPNRPSWMSKYDNPYSQNKEEYWTSPHEQDAWIAHRSREVIDHYLDIYKGDKSKVKNAVSSIMHDVEPEATWYKNPKIWRKYLNTLYSLV